MENSKIEWCTHTANLWWGCTSVHRGCDNCYAEKLSKRWGHDLWGNNKARKEIKRTFSDLDKYQRDAKKLNCVHSIFVGSMMDIFEKPFPLIDSKSNASTGNLRFQLFYRIDRGDYPNLLFLFLTKRSSNINKMIFESWKITPPKNVMFGYSPVDQKTFDDNVPDLLKVNGKRFLSIEPQLGEIDLGGLSGIDWIIQGGESGPRKRPFNLDWARSMRDQCLALGIPYFFKQIDKIQSIPEDLQVREFPKLEKDFTEL